MPELPEVETIARDVRPYLTGRTITRARVAKADILKNATRPAFIRAVTGRRVSSVSRRAKNVVILLDDDRRIVIQPGMTGAMLVEGQADRYDVIHFQLDSGVLVRYRDVRRLGRVYLFTPKQWTKHESRIGPEPLESSFTGQELWRVLRGSRAAVKKVIMDQRRLAGVGNIYANEALWIAGIDPSRSSRKIAEAEAVRLRDAIVEVLGRSIEGRGTTVRDYRTGTGEAGSFQGRLAVYERAGQPCPRCGRRIVATHAVDARSSYLCPGCQR